MKLLNLCSGATRPGDPWVNLDQLHDVLKPGTPERANLDAEPNYVEHDVLRGRMPFADDSFDGILASHCVEHWTCQEAVQVLRECHRILKPSGEIIVSVPDASYFRKVYESERDTKENAVELFGEPIHLPDGETTFFGYALWNRFHKAILTEDALWCYFTRAGLNVQAYRDAPETSVTYAMEKLYNRMKFSLLMGALKDERAHQTVHQYGA